MFKYFLALFAILAVTYLVAVSTLTGHDPNVITLRWVTDPNPARVLQCKLFEQLNPGIRVIPEAGDDDKLLIQCSVGVGPDLMDMSESLMQRMIATGVLMDITDAARAGGFSPADTFPEVRPVIEQDGRQYRYPGNISADVIFYNKAIFDDHGVPYPRNGWTCEDFIRAATAIKKNPSASGQRHFPFTPWSTLPYFRNLLAAHHLELFTPGGTRSTLDSPASLAAFRLYHDLIFKHEIIPTTEQSATVSSQGGWGSGGINLFCSGQSAMLPIGRWFTVQLGHYPGLRGKLGVVELPRVGNLEPASEITSRAIAINKFTKHPEAALKFLRYLAGADYARLIIECGDGLPPNPAYAQTGGDLLNQQLPDPAAQQIFLDAIHHSRPLGRSPHVDDTLVSRWLLEAVNRIENRLVAPEDAARELAAEINRAVGK